MARRRNNGGFRAYNGANALRCALAHASEGSAWRRLKNHGVAKINGGEWYRVAQCGGECGLSGENAVQRNNVKQSMEADWPESNENMWLA